MCWAAWPALAAKARLVGPPAPLTRRARLLLFLKQLVLLMRFMLPRQAGAPRPLQHLAPRGPIPSLPPRPLRPQATGASSLAAALTPEAARVLGKARRREWEPQPYRQQWLLLLEATLPGQPLFAGPDSQLSTEPIAHYRSAPSNSSTFLLRWTARNTPPFF